MINVTDLSANELKKIIVVKEQISELQSELDSIVSGNGHPMATIGARRRRRMSRAGRARIVAAVKARWARFKRGAGSKPAQKGKSAPRRADRRSSPAVRARLAAAARARWAKAKAAGKNAL
jgi:hypothetical protein